MLNLNDLRLFVRAVDSGGFAAAGRLLSAPKSTVSKRVAELEADLGVRLIHRTSRSFTLTETGREFYDHARAALIEADAAEDAVRRRLAEPAGNVRITASVPVAQFHLAPRFPALRQAYPKLHLDLYVTDRFVDLVHENFDIAIRSHLAPLPDSGLVQRRMHTEAIMLAAAPAYAVRCGLPATPEELASHDGINSGAGSETWRLGDGAGRTVEVRPRPVLSVNEAGVLLQSARAGIGIARLPETIARPSLECGDLVAVLPGWTEGTIATTILTPHRRGQIPGVRAVIGFLSGSNAVVPSAARQ